MPTIATPDPPQREPSRYGPAPTDVSHLVRNRLWAWLVWCLSSAASWDALDEEWLEIIDKDARTGKRQHDSHGRRRVLYRIFQQGHDPAETQSVSGLSMKDAVAKSPAHREATDLYDSLFWELTAAQEPAMRRVWQIEEQLLRTLGMVCLTPSETVVARLTRLDHLACSSDIKTIRAHIIEIAHLASIDAMALLGCRYRLALDRLAFIEADAYLFGLHVALIQFQHRWVATSPVFTAINALVWTRLARRPTRPVPLEIYDFVPRRRRNLRPLEVDDFAHILGYHSSARGVAAPPAFYDATLKDFFTDYASHYGKARQVLEDTLPRPPKKARISKQERVAYAEMRQRLIDEAHLGPLEMREFPAPPISSPDPSPGSDEDYPF